MITRRTFIRTSALAAAGLALAGGPIALAGCAPDGDVLRVGTKIDVPGFGFQNPETGNIEGMEVDIARELAKRIKGAPWDDRRAGSAFQGGDGNIAWR